MTPVGPCDLHMLAPELGFHALCKVRLVPDRRAHVLFESKEHRITGNCFVLKLKDDVLQSCSSLGGSVMTPMQLLGTLDRNSSSLPSYHHLFP